MHPKNYLQRRIAALAGILLATAMGVAVSRSADGGEHSIVVARDSSTGYLTGQETATGKQITPTAATGAIFQDLNPGFQSEPDVRVGHAAAVCVSPDGKLLAILTSGFNVFSVHEGDTVKEVKNEYVFLFDVTGPRPKQIQVLPIATTFQGFAWAPSSNGFFVSGGKDDVVLEFVRSGSSFAAGRRFALGHNAGIGIDAKPVTGAISLNPAGTHLLVTNFQNESVSLIDLAQGKVIAEQDLRPGKIDPKQHGQPGGSFPRSVVWTSNDHAYVACERDREIISLAISGATMRVVRRMPVLGQPVALITNRKGSRLYAAVDNDDQIAIFDTAHDTVIETIGAVAPQSVYGNSKKFGGVNPNALTLTPDERSLLVSNGGENAVAVIRLVNRASDLQEGTRTAQDHGDGDDGDDDDDRPDMKNSAVFGLVPTGWYPAGVATSRDGHTWYVVNGKTPSGPNVGTCLDQGAKRPCPASDPSSKTDEHTPLNQSDCQLEKAGFLTIPAPSAAELARLTKQVAHNNRFDEPATAAADQKLFSFLHEHIKHVIYIVKENRTYDQVLGDLGIGNSEPRLALFGEKLSPNHHAISRNFVTLDNFLVSGEVSWTGWDWSTAARTNDIRERQEPTAMADRGIRGEKGLNRNVNVAFATAEERKTYDPTSLSDPDVLPGIRDIYELDAPGGEEGKGYLWDEVLRRGLTFRNWGFFGDHRGYRTHKIPLVHDPHAENVQVYYSTKAALMKYSDPYYHDFEVSFPDYWRVQEWKREFAEFSAAKSAPNLMMVRLGNDHFGDFERAIDGINAPDTQMADNDYALGLIVETVAKSPFANDTVIISIEDDACDGADHVDANRSVTLFAGAYVRQHALVSTRYTTVSTIRTIEDILGLDRVSLNDALAAPMSDIFDPNVTRWSYNAIVPDILRSTKIPVPPSDHAAIAYPKHSAAYWTKAMAGQDFSDADRIEPDSFNRALWRGLKGDQPYPAATDRYKQISK
jgi:DNA-binding beta-propeller fold protein YncE